MSDTQWPAFEVFIQSRPGRPHQNVGAVHAPDSEMALLNARTVFVRRPSCHSMWVVPQAAITSCTAQQLEAGLDEEAIPPSAEDQSYIVCQKWSQRRGMTYVTHVGEVDASAPHQALRRAIVQFSQRPVYVWWVFPASAVESSKDDDIDTMFRPAEEKSYRDQTQYTNRRLP